MLEQTDEKEDELTWQLSSNIIRGPGNNNDWKNRRAVPLFELMDAASAGTRSSFYSQFDEGQIRVMASLVPDEIIYNIWDNTKRNFAGCLLFGDVSGFTDLCEKYNESGKGGPSRLTQVLNNYIGAMVQEILSHGGDVLKFSGDAFLALWKVTDLVSMRDAVHEAIDCSLVIQKSYGTYNTDVDVVVRVKLAVACGHMVFSLIGTEESSHYLMTGDPIYAIKVAEHLSLAGEIVITARVSRHITANEYLLHVLPDGIHAKVLGVGPNWRNIRRQMNDDYLQKKSLDTRISMESGGSLLSMCGPNTRMEADQEQEAGVSEVYEKQPIVTDQYALRPAVNFAVRVWLKEELKKFIIAPVMRGIDAAEPLEYLTEIRQVAILFMNCKVYPSVELVQGIDVGDKVYVTVCSIVNSRYGCVNKISNFDKDLMLLVIFGLRGFKHELESQIALKCAKETFEKVSAIDGIAEVAVAVTTGRCYCGAFGHSLRREYTVIGLIVNKAARLMVAYPNKVTCDKETFLFSKLEARNFILQEYKPLKGIVHPGPIYEFKEVERTYDLCLSISPFPLLGREQELNLCNTLLKKAISLSGNTQNKENLYNMLIIRGQFRHGKTRLLEEVIFTSDPAIPIHTFSLTAYDREIPYRMIQLLFLKFIGLPEHTAELSREKKVRGYLHSKARYSFVFNEVFHLNCKVTGKALSKEEELELLLKCFTKLCTVCFKKFWIIAIDDADYIDDESWMLLQALLDLRLVFILASMDTQKELTTYTLNVLRNEHIKVVSLKPVEKWYHAGLICQMLGVQGIPPELEKTVQTRSNGSPGWVESFLVTLMQSGGLDIVDIQRIEAYSQGLVMPPLYMLMRMSQEETDLWMEIMDEKSFSRKDVEMAKRWNIFMESCRESYRDLTVAKAFAEYNPERLTRVALLTVDVTLEDVVPEQHMEVVILKIFDFLTSYEQLLLKGSAVLGDIFPRDMLLYIMSLPASRITALAIQKLFENQVLSCARGNFIEGGLNFSHRLLNPNDDLSVKCECVGLIIEENCIDLPRYASCGYLRFRSPEFRKTTYSLLTDNQKKEFHTRAIRYMEKETRRCRECGSGYFNLYVGSGKYDASLRGSAKSKRSSIAGQESRLEVDSETGTLGRQDSDTSSIFQYLTIKSKSTTQRKLLRDAKLSEDTFADWNDLGYFTINRMRDKELVRTFSAYDYSYCTCPLILSTLYSQLLEHSRKAGLFEKILETTIEYAYVCLDNKNSPQAIKVLGEALVLLEGPMKDQIELDWMVDLKRGKLLTLIGRAKMGLEDEECYKCFKKALVCYGVSFPKLKITKFILKYGLKLKQNLRLFVGHSHHRVSIDEDLADYCNNLSECLHLLCNYFCKKGRWKEAELAAIWSLNKAMETQTNFKVLCLAYSSMIQIACFREQYRLCFVLEVYAFKMCHKKQSIVECEELKAIAVLYYIIARARFFRGEMDKTMQMSDLLWRISYAARFPELLLASFPLLAYGTIIRKQMIEYGHILNELSYLIEQDFDKTEMTWYHSLCLVLHLETGLVAQLMEKCNQFIQGEAFNETVRDPAGRTRLLICKWLWEVRNENWETAAAWQDLAWNYRLFTSIEKLNHMISGLYLLEGLIIYMVSKMDKKNIRASIRADIFICDLFQKFNRLSRSCSLLKPRVFHLKAYYIMAKYNDYKSAYRYLKRAYKLAEEQFNELEVGWILHSEQAWCNRLTQESKFAWQFHCDEFNNIQYNDPNNMDKIIYYSLPLPIYL